MQSTTSQHIESKPGVCGGKPCIAGTRIRVQDVYVWHEQQGRSVDQIVADFPQLRKADVYAALTYFWDHREEVLKEMADAEAFAAQIQTKTPSRLQAKLAGLNGSNDSVPPG